MLQQLERNAETHEIWGLLETEDHHAGIIIYNHLLLI